MLPSAQAAGHERLTQQLDGHSGLTPLPQIHTPKGSLEEQGRGWVLQHAQAMAAGRFAAHLVQRQDCMKDRRQAHPHQ